MQCSSRTQTGKLCQRATIGKNKLCWQHQSTNTQIGGELHSQIGGKLLGEGGTGCVYKPPLECQYQLIESNMNRENLLMKVMNPCQGYDVLDPEADEESPDYMFTEDEISKIIRILDPKSEYFIPLNGDYCSLKQNESNLQQLEECEGYKNSSHKRQFRGYFMKDGGQVLEEYVRRNKGKMDIYQALKWVIAIAQALEILHSHRIFHKDAHFGNIVIDDNQPKFIDFGSTQIVPEGEAFDKTFKEYENDDMRRFYSTVGAIYSANKLNFAKQSQTLAQALSTVLQGKYTTPHEVISFLTPFQES
jgi:serine/threonine protein kinase